MPKELVTTHKDDVKGSIVGLMAEKQKQAGQGPITDDTRSQGPIKFAGEPALFAAPALHNGVDLRAHELGKFDRMRKTKMPDNPITNKMKMDGVDAKVIATYVVISCSSVCACFGECICTRIESKLNWRAPA